MKKIAVVFLLGFALWALGQPGTDMNIPSIHVGETPWMLNVGSILMTAAIVAALTLIVSRRRKYLSRLNRAEMVAKMKANGGYMPFNP